MKNPKEVEIDGLMSKVYLFRESRNQICEWDSANDGHWIDYRTPLYVKHHLDYFRLVYYWNPGLQTIFSKKTILPPVGILQKNGKIMDKFHTLLIALNEREIKNYVEHIEYVKSVAPIPFRILIEYGNPNIIFDMMFFLNRIPKYMHPEYRNRTLLLLNFRNTENLLMAKLFFETSVQLSE